MKKILFALALLLAITVPGFAAIEKYEDVVLSSSGTVLNTPIIAVYLTGTSTLATVYGDINSSAKSNPFYGDSSGRYSFFAEEGYYDLLITKPGYASQTKTYLHMGPTGTTIATIQTNITSLQNDVATLQSSSVNLAVPGPIGGTTPNIATFTQTTISTIRTSIYSAGICSTQTATISADNGNVQSLILASHGTCTIGWTQPAAGIQTIALLLTQGTASAPVAWSSTLWPGGVAPTVSTTNGAYDWIVCKLDGTHTFCNAGGSQDYK